jgi:hypothetical protein
MSVQDAERALKHAAQRYAQGCEMFPGNDMMLERFAAELRVAAANYATAVA